MKTASNRGASRRQSAATCTRRVSHTNAIFEPLEDRRLMSTTIAFFDDPNFVNTASGSNSNDLLQQIQSYGTYNVKTFVGTTGAAFTSGLAGANLLLIPSLDKGDLNATLTNSTKAVISSFLNGGGGLLLDGNPDGHEVSFLNNFFDVQFHTTGTAGGPYSLENASGTKFSGAASSLPANTNDYPVDAYQLPVGATALYDQPIDYGNFDNAGVVLFNTATSNHVAYLSYDWTNGGPNGTQDGGWNNVLNDAIQQVAGKSTTVTTTISVTAPAAQTATVGVSKSFSLGSFTESNATGPYTATVVWGDGTANTTVKLTAAGTIPATAHTYTKAATDTVSVTVADSAGHTSSKVTFAVTVSAAVVNTGVISGTVFNDWNGDGKIDDGELGLGDYSVFIDLKGTGKFATGDPIAITAIDGTWSFTGLAAGTYKVMVEPETFAVQTTPKVLTITLKAGGKSTSNLFGEKSPG